MTVIGLRWTTSTSGECLSHARSPRDPADPLQSSSRLLNIVAKLSSTQFPASTERPPTAASLASSTSPFPSVGPSLSDDSRFSDPAFAGQPPEHHLKRQSLECLVAVLKSLVSWAARGGSTATTSTAQAMLGHPGLPSSESNGSLSALRSSEDGGATRGGSETDLSAPTAEGRPSGQFTTGGGSGAVTPDVVPSDDPSRFENAKQRKTTLLEGIKKFNFKPKRVSVLWRLEKH